jgi:hypothetical protein
VGGLFPSWRYGPDGQAEVFACADDVPSGWEDHPAKVCRGREKAASSSEDAQPAVSDQTAAAVAKFDHDGDGKPGGSLPKAVRKPRRKVKRRDPRK